MAQQDQHDVSPAEVEDHLGGVHYPARKQELKAHAQENEEVPSEVLEIIDQMPEQQYDGPTEVAQGVSAAQ